MKSKFALPAPPSCCRSGRLLIGALLTTLPWTSAFGQLLEPSAVYGTPMMCVEALHEGLINLSFAQDVGDLAQQAEGLRPLIAATHDLQYIAEFTIRRHWANLSDDDGAAFVQSFGRLSVMTYASRFGALSADSLSIHESRSLASGRAEVIASIKRAEDVDIPLEYVLHETDSGWRIINVVADGVSDLALKRAEYQRVLSDGSIADLIEVLEQQTAAL